MEAFEPINHGYNHVFKPQRLSIGVVVPIENYAHSPIPSMDHHMERVSQVEQLGFKALWLRDVPFHVPSFGDAGQTFDPFTYMGFLAARTSSIALGVASIALPLRHPLHVIKSATTIDQLSNGRLLLGVATGDRPLEYPTMNVDFESRGERFRESFAFIRKAQESFPTLETRHFGVLNGAADILPKAKGRKIPLLMTGYSQQTLAWNAENGDGWMSYPLHPLQQQQTISNWRNLVAQTAAYDKPFMQPLYVDLHENDDFKPQPIHLGLRIGVDYLIDYFHQLQAVGVNHIALNLRFNAQSIEKTLDTLATRVLPHFHKQTVS